MRRVNKNNNIMTDKLVCKKWIMKRKKYCKHNKKNAHMKNNKRGNRNKDQLLNNKINPIERLKYKSINGFIKNLKLIMNEFTNNLDNECFAYNSDLNFTDIMYCISKSVSNSWSSTTTCQHLKDKHIAHVTNAAINNKRKNINYKYFKLFYESLLDIVNVDINKFSNNIRVKYLYAVDGTKINFFKQLAKDDFDLSKNGNYCKTLMNTIYDVTNELPVNTIISKNMSEGALLIRQLNEIPKTSIILGQLKFI
jgi:hypothetical protein